MVFFALQRPDGQLPANNKRSETSFGQIQMVVPIAATAWELAQATGDHELLETTYRACSRWDGWLMRYRNTRGTGLIEGFCTYDTGMDNCPRWAGIPPQCPDKDAKKCTQLSTLPRLCPDLSATVYGARVALADMAKALGKPSEADSWTEQAEYIRKLILTKLYVPEDAAFYDLDAQNHFVKVRTCIVTRMCGEHVVDQKLFDSLWERQIHNPKAFWAPFPLPSVALDDPTFVRPIPHNSWGGAAQALTALRAGRWFDHYDRSAEFSYLMDQWCTAILRDMTFRQQIDPLSGAFTAGDLPNYSPAALVMLDFTWRLAGLHEGQQALQWNVRPGHPAAHQAKFSLLTDAGYEAEMRYDATGAALYFRGALLGRIEGGTARLSTDKRGKAMRLTGISDKAQSITFQGAGRAPRHLALQPNQHIVL
nr:alpha-L-rhamnosidase [Paracidobacterium acidisoli]